MSVKRFMNYQMFLYWKLFRNEKQIYGNLIKVLWGILFVFTVVSLIIVSCVVQKLFRDGHKFAEQLSHHELNSKWPGVHIEPVKQRFRHYAIKRNNVAIHSRANPIKATKKQQRVGTKLANMIIGKANKHNEIAKNKLGVWPNNVNKNIDDKLPTAENGTYVNQEHRNLRQISSCSESFEKRPWPYNRDTINSRRISQNSNNENDDNNLNVKSVNESQQYQSGVLAAGIKSVPGQVEASKKFEIKGTNQFVRNNTERKIIKRNVTDQNEKDNHLRRGHVRKDIESYGMLNGKRDIQPPTKSQPMSRGGKVMEDIVHGVEAYKELSRYRTESEEYSQRYDKWMQFFAKKFEKYDIFHEEEFEPLSGREVEGGFSMVRFYRELATGRKVAIKRVVRGEDTNMFFRSLELVIKEVEIMDKIYKHEVPFVSELHNVFKDEDNNVYMIMKYIGGKDLTDLLNEMRRVGIRRFSYEFAAGVVARVALALVGLHNINIAYKDLKYENIVIEYTRQEDPDTGEFSYYLRNARLIDYGLSEILTEESNFKCNIVNGTPTTLAPEVYNGGWHGTAADIWSLGVVLYMMLTGEESPFDHECSHMNCEVDAHDPTEIIRDHVLFKEVDFFADIFTPDAENLLRGMLERDPKYRFTAEEVIHHEWFKNNGISFKELFEQERRLIRRDRGDLKNSKKTSDLTPIDALYGNCSMINP